MLISQLNAKSEDHDGDLWEDLWALYAGGQEFDKRIHRFLIRNHQEPVEKYHRRCKVACYRSYIGTITDYFAALLFTTDLTYSPSGKESGPEWAEGIDDDCDGTGTDLVQFVRSRLIDAMVKGRGYWRLDFPDHYGTGTDKAAADRDGATDVRLAKVNREDVLDCELDRRGKLKWAIVHESSTPRDTPEAERGAVTVHRWWVLDRHSARLFEAEVLKGHQLDTKIALRPIAEHIHGLDRVPLVCIDPGTGLWVANRLRTPQLEHFRLTAANNWSMRATCYAMPVFSVKDPQKFNPTGMGAGYYLSVGVDESMNWTAPPVSHLAIVRDEIDGQKDEIFRLVTQMSLGVDNNAAAVGRSAESKVVDADAIQVVLRSYGAKVREAIRETLNMLSAVRGESDEWDVEGLDQFDTLPAKDLVAMLKEVIEFAIPSDTFTAEVMTRTAHAMLPGLDKKTKDLIREEVVAGIPEMAKRNDASHIMDAFHALDGPQPETHSHEDEAPEKAQAS